MSSAAAICRPYLCLDFGGTKICAGIVDAVTGKVLARALRSTPVTSGSSGGLNVALSACQEVVASTSIAVNALVGVGISFGGPVTADGSTVVRSMHVHSWENLSLPELISTQFGLPTAMENDANAAALAEWRYGIGRGAHNLFYLQLSTGIGSGLILQDRLYRGDGGAGEFGHVVVDGNGPECHCGRRGCLESVAAGWAIARDGQAMLADSRQSIPIDAELVIEQARRGVSDARQIIARAFSAVGQALATAVNLLDPGLIIVGGGMASADDLLFPWLTVELDRHVLPHLRGHTRVQRSELGVDTPLIGAAVVADLRFNDTARAGS